MALIETIQKEVLLNEAAKTAMMSPNLLSIKEAYSQLIGISDVDIQQYGLPLMPIYTAKSDELIDVPRIANFFKGLARDYMVIDQALLNVEKRLDLMGSELWARMQLVKSRANAVSNTAQAASLKLSSGSLWSYTETFTNTSLIDMVRSTVWLDSSEGIIFLPQGGDSQNVSPQNITITEQIIPSGGGFLGSTPSMAFDGQLDSNWRSWFVIPNTWASCTAELTETTISSITLEPVGFGTEVKIELFSLGSWSTVINSVLYSKTTFPVGIGNVSKMRVSFTAASASLPKAVGLSNIIIYTSSSATVATFYSQQLQSTFPFTQVQINLNADIPNGAIVTPYFSLDNESWARLEDGEWISTSDSLLQNLQFDSSRFLNAADYRGIYALPTLFPAASASEGELSVGVNQVEITAFRKDWTPTGQIPALLNPSMFNIPDVGKCWSGVRQISFDPNSISQRVIQSYGETIYLDPPNISRGNILMFQRQVPDRPYSEMCLVPFVGLTASNTMQFNHNYKFSFQVYAVDDVYYDKGLYWFLQGYRQPGARSFKDISQNYGSFTMYINGNLIASNKTPYSVFTDGTTEQGAEVGTPLIIALNKGWNTVDIMVNVIDPNSYYTDSFNVGDPYLQLSIEPSFFSSNFQSDLGITQILASGITTPMSEFDLIWNSPADLSSWAWSDDLNSLLFNQISTNPIDGYYSGSTPNYDLKYKSFSQNTPISSLYIRLDLSKEQSALSGPIIRDYKVLVK